MKLAYPALFYCDNEQSGYFIHFPDFKNSATQGDTITEALDMASEYLAITIADYIENDQELPKPSNINNLSLTDNDPFKDDPEFDSQHDMDKSFISMVSGDPSLYMESEKPIKKTLTIPLWADNLGKKMGLNFSQTLTDAIFEKKIGL